MNLLAIDPSSSSTGTCFRQAASTTFHTIKQGKTDSRFDMLLRIYRYVRTYQLPPRTLVLIEGYAFRARTSSITKLAEVGGVIRLALLQRGLPFVEVPSTSWKAIMCGKGNVNKARVAEVAEEAYGKLWNTQDECDAFMMSEAVLAALRKQSSSKWALDLRKRVRAVYREQGW